jgi:hypothetical protein
VRFQEEHRHATDERVSLYKLCKLFLKDGDVSNHSVILLLVLDAAAAGALICRSKEFLDLVARVVTAIPRCASARQRMSKLAMLDADAPLPDVTKTVAMTDFVTDADNSTNNTPSPVRGGHRPRPRKRAQDAAITARLPARRKRAGKQRGGSSPRAAPAREPEPATGK